MHTVEQLELALAAAEQLGYRVRQEWLGGIGGGGCLIAGRKWIFLDLALNPMEQLDQVLSTLRDDPGIYSLNLHGEMRRLLGIRNAA